MKATNLITSVMDASVCSRRDALVNGEESVYISSTTHASSTHHSITDNQSTAVTSSSAMPVHRISSSKSHNSPMRKRTSSEVAVTKADTAHRKAIAEWNRRSRQIAAAEAAHLHELRLRAEIGQRCRASYAYQLAHPSVKQSMRKRIREGILREREERRALLRAKRAEQKGVKFEDEVDVDMTSDRSSEEDSERSAEGSGSDDHDEDDDDRTKRKAGETVYMQLRRWAAKATRERDTVLTFQEVNRRHMSPHARLASAAESAWSSRNLSPAEFSSVMPVLPDSPPSTTMARPTPSSSRASTTSSLSSIDDEPVHKPVDVAPGVFVDWKPTTTELMSPHYELSQQSCLRDMPLPALTPRELSTIDALHALHLKTV